MTDQRQYNRRYKQAYVLCKKLLKQKIKLLGKSGSNISEKTIQSVLGSFEVTKLIMYSDFNPDIYIPVLKEEIENTRKELFPDLAKNRFITLDNLKPDEFNYTQNTIDLNEEYLTTYTDYKHDLLNHISRDAFDNSSLDTKTVDRIKRVKKLFSDGSIPDISAIAPLNPLSEKEIINVYKLVLSGIEKSFPKNFLAVNGKLRCKVITRFLCEDINNLSSPSDLHKLDEYFFLDNKLLNILRFFNYSVNQVLLNAFPDKIQPWVNGRISNNFWQEKQNRISAVKWLVADKLSIDVKTAGKIIISKNDFNRNGLSYLFNSYYNSVSKALSEAYPLLMPWQISSLPTDYWTQETISLAVRWMFRRLKWKVDTLPKRYNLKELNRKTFSQFGLSGLFENKFNCNIYKILSYVYPGKFNEWEFIQLNSSFWLSVENRAKFTSWIENKFKIDILETNKQFSNLKDLENFRFYASLKKYSKGDLTNLAKVYAQDLAEVNKSRIIQRKWDNLIKQEKKTMLHNFLIHGLFYSMVKVHTENRMERFIRKRKRSIQQLSIN